MLEAALLSHDRIPGNALNRGFNRVAGTVGDAHGVLGENGHLAIAEKKDIARVLKNRRNIRSYKEFVVAEADHNRRTLPHRDDRVGFIGVDDRKRKNTF